MYGKLHRAIGYVGETARANGPVSFSHFPFPSTSVVWGHTSHWPSGAPEYRAPTPAGSWLFSAEIAFWERPAVLTIGRQGFIGRTSATRGK